MRFHLPKAAYVHIPFCLSKCHYCDFNSFAGLDSLHDDYIAAVLLDIEYTAVRLPPPLPKLETIYYGGGTPTVLKPQDLAHILTAIKGAFGVADDAEITVEANPDTVTPAGLHILRGFGFNRISLGAQSFCDELLQGIGRRHDSTRTIQAVSDARQAGFDNLGLDLIFALPEQTLNDWRMDLNQAIELQPQHISVYELTIEDGTPLGEARKQGKINPAEEDTGIAMYEAAIEALGSAGYEHYEVSNFALPGCRSRHNTVYWHNQPYYGFGAGAAGFVDGMRHRRLSDPAQYIEAVGLREEANEFSEELAWDQFLGETMMLRLRLLEGMDLREFEAEYGVNLQEHFKQAVGRGVSAGLLELGENNLKLTHRGLLLLNDVAAEFMPD